MAAIQTHKKGLLWLIIGMFVIGIAACSKEEPKKPSRWDVTQEKSEGQKATDKQAVAGKEFNKFFPQSGEGFSVVYTQEKTGFAEAKVEKDGKEVATLAVFDTISNPSAAEKYQDSAEKLNGHPMVAIGGQGTAILIDGRFQVQVRSKDAVFDADARKAWLQKFDVNGLAGLTQ